jgi:hypothetical protein
MKIAYKENPENNSEIIPNGGYKSCVKRFACTDVKINNNPYDIIVK